MKVFQDYADYYDLFYREKDYAGEAGYVHRLIQEHAPGATTLLDLGCGTGSHAEHLAGLGYQVCGVDCSETMLRQARNRLSQAGEAQRVRLSFLPGDTRTLRTGRRYDAVISLFHVMSYQSTDEDLRDSFETARIHLKPRGVFLFDCWYGPAVIKDPPVHRIRHFSDGEHIVRRIADPVMDLQKKIVDVRYHIIARDKAGKILHEVRETHRMRYLFQPEISDLAQRLGFKLIASHRWKTLLPPSEDNWNACFVVRI
jgi:SAM-dependent methyltransferase